MRVIDGKTAPQALEDFQWTMEELDLDVSLTAPPEEQTYPGWMESQFLKHQKVIHVFQWVILLFALGGAANLMLSQRQERIREIGLLKTLGASFGRLFFHFLRESVIVGLLAGVVGSLLGLLVAQIMGWLLGWTLQADMGSIRLGMCVSVGASLLVGIVPAWLGARLDPAEALRHE